MNLWRAHRNIKLRLGVGFVNRLLLAMMGPLMAIYLASRFGLAAAGLMLSVVVVATMVFTIIGGHLADHRGRRATLLITESGVGLGYVGMALATMAFWNSPVATFCFFVVATCASGMGLPANDAVMMDVATPELRTSIYTINYWSLNLAFAFGAMIGSFFYGSHFPELLLGGAVLTVAVFTVTYLWLSETAPQSAAPARGGQHAAGSHAAGTGQHAAGRGGRDQAWQPPAQQAQPYRPAQPQWPAPPPRPTPWFEQPTIDLSEYTKGLADQTIDLSALAARLGQELPGKGTGEAPEAARRGLVRTLVSGYAQAARDRLFGQLVIAAILISAVEMQLTYYIGIKLADGLPVQHLLHLGTWQVSADGVKMLGILRTLNTVLVVVIALFSKKLFGALPDNVRLHVGIAVFVAGFMVLAVSRNGWLLIAMAVIFTVGELMNVPVRQTIMADIINPAMRAKYVALYGLRPRAAGLIASLSVTIGSVLNGWAMALIFGLMGAASMLLLRAPQRMRHVRLAQFAASTPLLDGGKR